MAIPISDYCSVPNSRNPKALKHPVKKVKNRTSAVQQKHAERTILLLYNSMQKYVLLYTLEKRENIVQEK